MAEKNRHVPKGGTKAHNAHNKHKGHFMANKVNHDNFERNHGFESTKHKENHDPKEQAH